MTVLVSFLFLGGHPMEKTGRVVKIVSVDLNANRATVMNIAIHTFAVNKIKAPVAVIQGELCPHERDCPWCFALRERIERSRKE